MPRTFTGICESALNDFLQMCARSLNSMTDSSNGLRISNTAAALVSARSSLLKSR